MKVVKAIVPWVFCAVLVFVVLAVILAAFGVGDKAKPKRFYKTEAQAESYVRNDLRSWGGLDLSQYNTGVTYPDKDASCSDYAVKNTDGNKDFPSKTTASGEAVYASFACELTANASADDRHTFELYVRPLANSKWSVEADR